jgi:hypothetical protein
MLAACILGMSVVLLIQFAVAQWRSMWTTVAAQPLSPALEAATGISSAAIGPQHFDVLARASEEIASGSQPPNSWLREVRLYYCAVRNLQSYCATALPSLSRWAASELATCSRYAAAVLDQRLNTNLAYVAGRASL